ncbi:hypothetical protein ABZ234_31840 [Nocardiopsis sp. NPDC006198]|uniref:hypothetical protein n=1 Tax=Nocardiopsis sp. NPDC006198 TaxID=3154472 RepID=UPI00339E918B
MGTCADLDCDQEPTTALHYRAPDGAPFAYRLCPRHTDRAEQWLAGRPHLAATAVFTPLAGPATPPRTAPEPADQPVLF